MKMRHALCVLLCSLLSNVFFAVNDLPLTRQDSFRDVAASPLPKKNTTLFPSGASTSELSDYFNGQNSHGPSPIKSGECPTSPITRQVCPTSPITRKGCPTSPIRLELLEFLSQALRAVCATTVFRQG